MERKINFSEGEFYHVYNRGNNKNNIFRLNSDYVRFMFLLFVANSKDPVRIENISRQKSEQGRTLLNLIEGFEREETLVDIGAYCLMPNHFHILIRGKQDGGVSTFMQKLGTGYSMYFNKRHERTGTLFEGKFKAEHVHTDEHLKYLFSYIHLNPIKFIEPEWKEIGVKDVVRVKKHLKEYQFSSYLDHLGHDRVEKKILNKNTFPEYFEDFKKFEDFIDEWINYKNTQGE